MSGTLFFGAISVYPLLALFVVAVHKCATGYFAENAKSATAQYSQATTNKG